MPVVTIQAPYRPEQGVANHRLTGVVTGNVYLSDGLGRVTVDALDVPNALTRGYVFASVSGGGGGGGGGIITVAAIAALSALPVQPNGTVAVVTDPLRGGTFIYSSANHSGAGDSAVPNDPGGGGLGGGITVAPASDPSGVSGAWIRQYGGPVRMSWWGVKSDGVVTDPYGKQSNAVNILGVTNPSGSTCRLQVTSTVGMNTGDNLLVAGNSGVPNVNGSWVSAYAVNSSSFYLPGAVFNSAWTSGGTVTNGTVTTAVVGTGNAGAGIVVTVVSTAGFLPTDKITISGVGGTTNANGVASTVVVDSAHIDLPHFIVFSGTTSADGTVLSYDTIGPIIHGGTVNNQSLVNWQVWAINQSAAGNPVHSMVDAGTLLWSSRPSVLTVNTPQFNGTRQAFSGLAGIGGAYQFFSGITDLTIECDNGFCALQNDINMKNTSSNGMPIGGGSGIAFPQRTGGLFGGTLINQTAPGDASVVVQNPSDLATFAAGQYVMIGSLDTFYTGGSPLNQFSNPGLQYFEFHKITGISGGTVSLDGAIRFQHRTDYAADASGTAAKARLWGTNPNWGGKFITKNIGGNGLVGIENNFSGFNSNYQSWVGWYIETNNWRGLGPSESSSKTVIHYNPIFETVGEPDKCVEDITYVNGKSAIGLTFQSACPQRLTFIGGEYAAVFGLGQFTVADGVRIGQLTLACSWGYSAGGAFTGCEITKIDGSGVTDGIGTLVNINSGYASYLNGVITLNKAAAAIASGGNAYAAWQFIWSTWIPGMTFFLESSAGVTTYTFDVVAYGGIGIVKSVTEDGSGNIIIHTDLPYGTLPSWASGLAAPFHVGQVQFNNCWGGEAARMYSRACAKGYAYYEYVELVYSNPGQLSRSISPGGELISVEVDVFKTGAASNSLKFDMLFTIADARVMTSGSAYTVSINYAGGLGKRVITQSNFSGPSGTTDVLSPIPPASIASSVTITFNSAFPVSADYLAPSFVIKMISDCGIARKGPTYHLDTTNAPLITINGPFL